MIERCPQDILIMNMTSQKPSFLAGGPSFFKSLYKGCSSTTTIPIFPDIIPVCPISSLSNGLSYTFTLTYPTKHIYRFENGIIALETVDPLVSAESQPAVEDITLKSLGLE